MQKDIRIQSIFYRIKHPAFLLFAFSLLGLILGTLFAVRADTSLLLLMRQVKFSSVSIIPSVASQLLPFLIAAYAVLTTKLLLMVTVCSCKLFSFAFTGALIQIAFGSAGWLVRFLFLFSDIILVPCIYWYCFRQTTGKNDKKKDFGICMGIAIVTALIDCLIISPLLAKIF